MILEGRTIPPRILGAFHLEDSERYRVFTTIAPRAQNRRQNAGTGSDTPLSYPNKVLVRATHV